MTQPRPLAAMSSPRSAARFLLTAVLLSFGFVAATTTAFAQAAAAAPVTQGETPITITVGDTVMTGRLNDGDNHDISMTKPTRSPLTGWPGSLASTSWPDKCERGPHARAGPAQPY